MRSRYRPHFSLAGLDDVEQLALEHQGLVRADRACALLAIGQLARDPEAVLAADRHQRDAFLPARHQLAEHEGRRLATVIGAVEGLAVEQRALVMRADRVGDAGLGALAFGQDLVLQARSGRHDARLLAVLGHELLAVLEVLLGVSHHLGDALGLHLLRERFADLRRLLLVERQLLAGERTLERLVQGVRSISPLTGSSERGHVHADHVADLLFLLGRQARDRLAPGLAGFSGGRAWRRRDAVGRLVAGSGQRCKRSDRQGEVRCGAGKTSLDGAQGDGGSTSGSEFRVSDDSMTRCHAA